MFHCGLVFLSSVELQDTGGGSSAIRKKKLTKTKTFHASMKDDGQFSVCSSPHLRFL